MDDVVRLLTPLGKVTLDEKVESIWWRWLKGFVSQLSCFAWLLESHIIASFLWSWFGDLLAAQGHLFHMESSLGKIPMLDQLKRKGLVIAFDAICVLREWRWSITFFFTAWRWGCCKSFFLSLFGISWVIPRSVGDTLLSWRGVRLERDQQRLGKQHPLVYFGQFGKQEMQSIWGKILSI